MQDNAARRKHQEEIDKYLATKELEMAKTAYATAKEAYDKGKQHDEQLRARTFPADHN